MVNTVEVSSSTRDPYPDNNRFELVTPIAPMPELFITKTAYPDCAIPCEYLIYTILVENSGSADAEEVVLTDYVPRNFVICSFPQTEAGPGQSGMGQKRSERSAREKL